MTTRKPRVDASTRGRVTRALEGRCHDCRGEGQRSNLQRRTVSCVTCSGSGRIDRYSIGAVANAAGVTVAKTLDALADLHEAGLAECVSDGGVDLWRAVRRTG
jgi:DnaJ-class molecular chaperone